MIKISVNMFTDFVVFVLMIFYFVIVVSSLGGFWEMYFFSVVRVF